MNALDLTVLALATLASVVGAALGLVRSLAVWIGLALGTALGVALLPTVADRVATGTDLTTLLGPVTTVLLGAGIGAALGGAAGAGLRGRRTDRRPGRPDRLLGSAVGALTVVALAWILIPLAAASRGWPDEITRGSSVARLLDRHGPELPGPLVDAIRTLAAERPDVVPPVVPSGDPGPPPTSAVLAPGVAARAAAATVRIEGRACSLIQDGTGVVVGADLVLTAAHVVAGEPRTAVVRPDGSSLVATVVAFDPPQCGRSGRRRSRHHQPTAGRPAHGNPGPRRTGGRPAAAGRRYQSPRSQSDRTGSPEGGRRRAVRRRAHRGLRPGRHGCRLAVAEREEQTAQHHRRAGSQFQ